VAELEENNFLKPQNVRTRGADYFKKNIFLKECKK
jgi:hypothetical protein